LPLDKHRSFFPFEWLIAEPSFLPADESGAGQFFLFGVRAERCDFGPRPVCRGAAVILVQGVLLSLTALSVGALKIFPFKLQTNTVHGIFCCCWGEVNAPSDCWRKLRSDPPSILTEAKRQPVAEVMVCRVGLEMAGFLVLSGTVLSGWVPPLATPIQQRFGSEFTFPTRGVASDPSSVSAGVRGEYKRDPLTAAGPRRFLRSKGCRKNNWIKLGIGGARFSCAGEMKLRPFLFPSPLKAEGC